MHIWYVCEQKEQASISENCTLGIYLESFRILHKRSKLESYESTFESLSKHELRQ